MRCHLQEGLEAVLDQHRLSGVVNRVGYMLTLFFGVDRVQFATDARCCDCGRFACFFHGMLKRGVYFPQSPFEAAFISLAHGRRELEKALQAFEVWARREGKGTPR